eukprot:2353439-Pleurochrysis_carterae.AAC.1
MKLRARGRGCRRWWFIPATSERPARFQYLAHSTRAAAHASMRASVTPPRDRTLACTRTCTHVLSCDGTHSRARMRAR